MIAGLLWAPSPTSPSLVFLVSELGHNADFTWDVLSWSPPSFPMSLLTFHGEKDCLSPPPSPLSPVHFALRFLDFRST